MSRRSLISFAALLLALTSASLAFAGRPAGGSVVVSKALGLNSSQLLTVGGGAVFGSLGADTSVLTVKDLSVKRDLKVVTSAPDTGDGVTRHYVPPSEGTLAFRVTGSYYELATTGVATVNGVSVYGTLKSVKGRGMVRIDAAPKQAWARDTTFQLAPIPPGVVAPPAPASPAGG